MVSTLPKLLERTKKSSLNQNSHNNFWNGKNFVEIFLENSLPTSNIPVLARYENIDLCALDDYSSLSTIFAEWVATLSKFLARAKKILSLNQNSHSNFW